MDPILVSTAFGAVSPFVLAVLEQPAFPRWARVLLAYAVCIAVGVELAAANHQLHIPTSALDGATMLGDVVTVLVASQAVYTGLSKSGVLDAIENATNLGRLSLQSPVVLHGGATAAIPTAQVADPTAPAPATDSTPATPAAS